MTEAPEIQLPRLSREQLLWIVGSLLLAGWLIWLLAPVLTPFMISALLAYMADPTVTRLERWMRRDVAVSLVFVLVLALTLLTLLLIVPVLVRETTDLFSRLPAYFEQLQQRLLPWAEQHLGWDLDPAAFDAARLREILEENFANLAAAGRATWAYVSESGGRFVIWITGLILVPLVTFYLMRDWHKMLDVLRDILPRNLEPTVVDLVHDCDEALGGFLRGQLLVMLSLGVIYAIGLWLVGLNNGIAIGMIAGLVSFVPYLGAITGVLLAGTTAIIQNFEFWFLVSIAIVFTVGQLIESFLLTPKLVGDRIGLHPVLVVFTVLAGGQLFGFIGVLLALPVAAAGTVLVRFFYRGY
ncbi:MAG: AI-2E family transporter, partial [Wenzhouxiangellaceae bacterium]